MAAGPYRTRRMVQSGNDTCLTDTLFKESESPENRGRQNRTAWKMGAAADGAFPQALHLSPPRTLFLNLELFRISRRNLNWNSITSWKNPSDKLSRPGPFGSVVANKAKVRDPSILCCMGLFAFCSLPQLQAEIRKPLCPAELLPQPEAWGKQMHAAHLHRPAFPPFMQAQLTSLFHPPPGRAWEEKN